MNKLHKSISQDIRKKFLGSTSFKRRSERRILSKYRGMNMLLMEVFEKIAEKTEISQRTISTWGGTISK
jgi:hypothetical protein